MERNRRLSLDALAPNRFDWVVANLLLSEVEPLLRPLCDRVGAGGRSRGRGPLCRDNQITG